MINGRNMKLFRYLSNKNVSIVACLVFVVFSIFEVLTTFHAAGQNDPQDVA